MKCIFSIDVEDWFHILDLKNTPGIAEWDSLTSVVERDFLQLLDIFSERDIKVTCFFLGWIAAKYPYLVKEAACRGHEIASHGYAHNLVYKMSEKNFFEDARKSKSIIEDIIGKEITGFRAPGFSHTEDTPWFFEKLIEAGYKYDSSLFPIPRLHGGIKSTYFAPHKITNEFMEFPITLVKSFNRYKCFFGGGYLRNCLYFRIKDMAHKVLKENRPVIFYVHPREIDPNHPRLPMGLVRYIKSYGFLWTTEKKLRMIINDFEFTTFVDYMVAEMKADNFMDQDIKAEAIYK